LLEHGDLMAHFECNREFHGLARRHSGNALLEQILGSLEEKADTYRRAAAKESNIVEELLISMEEHLDVLEMYRKRDLQGALTMMDRHLVMTCERLGAKLRPLVGSARKPDS
jgi:DNA-binding GntR family transcriptional regulator